MFQVLKNPSRPTAKGNYWTVNTSVIPRDLLARQNTHVSRDVQDHGLSLRKDLTEIFDCRSGNIKVDIPQSLFKGSDLIDQPALVMERLLLEPKDGGEPMIPNDGRFGKIYSLVDMFNQEDFLEDISRPNSGPNPSSWPDSGSKRRTFSPLPQRPLSASKIEQRQRGSPPVALPSHNELLARALTGQIPPTSLPLIQALYNNYLQNFNGMGQLGLPANCVPSLGILPGSYRSQSGAGSVTSRNGSPSDSSDSGSDDEARKWGREEAQSSPPTVFPSLINSAALLRGQQSPDLLQFSTSLNNDEAPRGRQGTVKGLFAAFSARPLEI